MYLVINKCVTAVKVLNFSCHYLRNRSTLDIGVLGYIGIVQHKEHSPEVLSIPPGTSCIYIYIYIYLFIKVNFSRNRPGQAQGIPGSLRPLIFLTFGTTRVVGRQPYSPATFTPVKIPGTHFWRLSRPQGTWFRR